VTISYRIPGAFSRSKLASAASLSRSNVSASAAAAQSLAGSAANTSMTDRRKSDCAKCSANISAAIIPGQRSALLRRQSRVDPRCSRSGSISLRICALSGANLRIAASRSCNDAAGTSAARASSSSNRRCALGVPG
jgi:hypothetical protein